VHVIGAWLLFPDGKTQHSGVEVYDIVGPWADDKYRDTFDHSLSRYCHHVTGAWQAIRLNQVTLQYDERFAFAFEDVDFCLRNWEIGRRTYFLKNIVHIHHEGATRGRTITPIQMESAKTFRETEYDWDGLNHHLNFALTNGGLLGTRHLVSLPVSNPHAPQS
jgi:GT2 family glycosyltransferase